MERGKIKKAPPTPPDENPTADPQLEPKTVSVWVEVEEALVALTLESREETVAELVGRMGPRFPGRQVYLFDADDAQLPDDARLRLARQPVRLVLRHQAGAKNSSRMDANKADKTKRQQPKPKGETSAGRRRAKKNDARLAKTSLAAVVAAGEAPDPTSALDFQPMDVAETAAARCLAQKVKTALVAGAASPFASAADADAAQQKAAELDASLAWQGRHLKARQGAQPSATGQEPRHVVADLLQRERLAAAASSLQLLARDVAKHRLPDDLRLADRVAALHQQVLAHWFPDKFFFPHEEKNSVWDLAWVEAERLAKVFPGTVPQSHIMGNPAAVPAADSAAPASETAAAPSAVPVATDASHVAATPEKELFRRFVAQEKVWERDWPEVVRWIRDELIPAYRNGDELVEEDGVAVLRSIYDRPGIALHTKTEREAKIAGLANAGATCWLQTALLMLRETAGELTGTELWRELAKGPPSGVEELFLAFLQAHVLSLAAPDTATTHVYWLAQAAGLVWADLEGNPRTSHHAADEALNLIAALLVERFPHLSAQLQFQTKESSSCGPQCANSAERRERHNIVRVRMAQMALDKGEPLDLVGALEKLALEEEELENRCCERNSSETAKQRRDLTFLPTHLFVHINREDSRKVLGPDGKPEAIVELLHNPLTFKDAVDLKRVTSPPANDDVIYGARELVLYTGNRNQGHYITIKADGTGKLILVDNQRVEEAMGALQNWEEVFQLQGRQFFISIVHLKLLCGEPLLHYILDTAFIPYQPTEEGRVNLATMGMVGGKGWEQYRGLLEKSEDAERRELAKRYAEPEPWELEVARRVTCRESTEEEEEQGVESRGPAHHNIHIIPFDEDLDLSVKDVRAIHEANLGRRHEAIRSRRLESP